MMKLTVRETAEKGVDKKTKERSSNCNADLGQNDARLRRTDTRDLLFCF